MYMARKHLIMSEAEFWSTRPRKLHAMLNEHAIMQGGAERKDKKDEFGYIDQIDNWD